MSSTDSLTGEAGEVRAAVRAVRQRWLAVAAVTLAAGLLALGYSLIQSPTYRSTATLYVTSASDDASSTAYQGSLASQQRVISYTQLATSDVVVGRAVTDGRLPLSTASAVAALSITSPPETVLLKISASNTNREVARDLANAVAQSMTSYVVKLETPAGGGQPLAALTVITPAVSSSAPVSPRPVRNTLLGVAAGLLAGLVYAVLSSRFSTRVRSPRDLSPVGDEPILASIPNDKLLTEGKLLDFTNGASPAAEAFRKMRTNLTYTRVDNPARILLVASSRAGEGKTTVALNLAKALVETGKRVVVVDADLRRPATHARLGLVNTVGLTTWIAGEAALEGLLQRVGSDDLFLLASGPLPPNPAEILGANRTQEAIVSLAKSFDHVIIDSPPVLPVTDAVVAAQWSDGVVVVVEHGKTKVSAVGHVRDQLTAAGATVLGYVLAQSPVEDRYVYGQGGTYAGAQAATGAPRPRSRGGSHVAEHSDFALRTPKRDAEPPR